MKPIKDTDSGKEPTGTLVPLLELTERERQLLEVIETRAVARENRTAERTADLVRDSNPYDPKKVYSAVKDELRRELGEGTLNQATWIIVNGIRAIVALVVLAFAAWVFDLHRWLRFGG